jgi:uncharacterized protein with PIN domain
MAESNWKIKWPTEEDEQYTTILDFKNKQLKINEHVIPITKDYLLITAQILTRAKGAIVTESVFTEQYYQTHKASNQEATVDLRKYCSELNSEIKAVMGFLSKEERVFINTRSRGYHLNPKYLPAQIQE